MNLKNQIRPYYVCGGFPKGDAWIFFTPGGEIKINGCNKMIKVLLSLCNGYNLLDFVEKKLEGKFSRKDIKKLIDVLFEHLILVDSNRIFQILYAYSKNPMPFFESLNQEETHNLISDKGHLLPIGSHYFKAQFKKTGILKIMDLRCSTRDFSKESVSEEIILSLVWSAYGQQTKRRNNECNFLERTFTVPSGGALYPLSIYVILFKRCGSMVSGVYLWHKEENLLELIKRGNFLLVAERVIDGIPSLRNAAGVVCVVADFERSAKKYGNKSYNLIQQEAGHVMQNIALFCAEKNIGFVEIGGYHDKKLAEFLKLRFPSHAPLIVSAFGKKRSRS